MPKSQSKDFQFEQPLWIGKFFTLLLTLVALLVLPERMWTQTSETAIATLGKTEGHLTIARAGAKNVPATDGTLLFRKDAIKTGTNGRATVLFRDGSEVRLFENTDFLIEDAAEEITQERSFGYNLAVKAGSLWGKFVPGKQKTEIKTPTVILGVKGTTLRLTETAEGASVALTGGLAQVRNLAGSVDLKPGSRLEKVSSRDILKEKVSEIPYKLIFRPDNTLFTFQTANEEILRLGIQMIEVRSGQNIHRPGRVYLGSDYYNLSFPNQVMLDDSGYTRIPVTIRPPKLQDRTFDGRFLVWAVMDEMHFGDVGEGQVLLQIKMPPKTRNLHIDTASGAILTRESLPSSQKAASSP